MDEIQPFIDSLKDEQVIKQYGVEAILFDLVSVILKKGELSGAGGLCLGHWVVDGLGL